MAIDPIGQNSYKGLAVPLYGESVIEQQNSSNAILTMMHSSLNSGRFVMGLDYKDEFTPSSLIGDLAVFDIDADGGFRVVSGSTVIAELNSSGFYIGSTQVFAAAGDDNFLGGTRTKVATATTSYTFVSTLTGSMVVTASASTSYVTVPASAMAPGDTFDVLTSAAAGGDINVQIAGATTGRFLYHSGSTNVIVSSLSVTNAGAGWFFARFVCLTTNPPVYLTRNMLLQSGNVTTNSYYGLAVGSTST